MQFICKMRRVFIHSNSWCLSTPLVILGFHFISDVTVCNLNPLNSLTEFEGQIRPFDEYMNWIDHLSEEGLSIPQLMTDLDMSYEELEEVYNEAFSVYGYFQNINEDVIEALVNKSAKNTLILDCKWYVVDSPEHIACIKFWGNQSWIFSMSC